MSRRRSLRAVLGEQLLTVAGANREVLQDAPKERGKQVAMGAVLVCTAALAAVSASYALYVALHLWVPVAVLGGLAWGLVILNLDRWLVVSTPRLTSKVGTIAMALPRVALAVLIGAVVSTPLTLAVFSAEIDTEVEVMAAEAEDEFTQQLAEDTRYADLPAQRERIAALQADIADGVTQADVAEDPAVAALQARFDDVDARYNAAEAAYNAELDGSGGTGQRGYGPATTARQGDRDRLRAERDDVAAELEALEAQTYEQLLAEEAQNTVDQQADLEELQVLVADAEEQRAADVAAHDAAVDDSDGILARMTAMERIQDDEPTLATAHALLFAFLTALECLPILFKTMLALAPPSLYERLLALGEEKVEERVRLRMQTEYEEAEVLAKSALAAAEARAARTLEAESRATGLVLEAQLEVTRQGVERWKDQQLTPAGSTGLGTSFVKQPRPGPRPDPWPVGTQN
ncbi:hypothetical protein GCM10027261_24870 [Geodermatophilus arenarius]|uniref:DUF4407 domain-containing protein n=1 Tax=Geodermatophilus arenarius TaxID=1137990 RepID=A0ABV9LIQ0_9ACTN